MIGGAVPQLSDDVLDEIAVVLVDEAETWAKRKDRTPAGTTGPQRGRGESIREKS